MPPDTDRWPEGFAALLATWGAGGRVLERVAMALADGGTIGEVVRRTGAARRTVDEVVRSFGPAVTDDDGVLRLTVVPPAPPPAPSVAEIVAGLEPALAHRPAPDTALDHVTATVDTIARRAILLAEHFRLGGASVVLLGDHDLTALAVRAVAPDAAVTVVDIDLRVLGHLRRVDPAVVTIEADLRSGVPPAVTGSADIVVTDPPYSPDGVALFVAAGVTALRDHDHGRIVLAYGHGEQLPALGFKVQDELNRLRLTIEALLPDFNHYDGAEAIGARSDLYLLRPTRRSAAAAAARLRSAGRAIYSKGPDAQARR